MTIFLAAILLFYAWFRWKSPEPTYLRYGRRATADEKPPYYRTRHKPDWVPDAIVYLKAMQPHLSCRDIAHLFNRLYAATRQVTVGKTYVSDIIKRRAYAIADIRRRVRGRQGKPGPLNITWGVDLTGKTDTAGNLHMILGVVDHGSRKNLSLTALKNKTSIAILRVLLDVIENRGAPRFIRTDNESCFTSRLFRFGLRLFGIRHQTTEIHCPWMNGRIERFFLTLKQKLDHWHVPDFQALQQSLAEFRFWYNQVRPHQSLYGRTPAELWHGTDVYRRHSTKVYWFSTWDGLLSGIYIPP